MRKICLAHQVGAYRQNDNYLQSGVLAAPSSPVAELLPTICPKEQAETHKGGNNMWPTGETYRCYTRLLYLLFDDKVRVLACSLGCRLAIGRRVRANH